MTPPTIGRRLRAIGAIAGALLLGACGSGGGSAGTTTPPTAPPSSTTSAPPTTATTTTVASTSTTATTVPAPATTAVPTTAAPANPGAQVVTADDAVLKPPASPVALDLGGTDPCRLLTGTAHLGGCGVVAGAQGRLVWFTSDADSPDPTAVVIYRIAGGQLLPTLELPDDQRAEEALAHVEVANLDGRAGDELVVGFRDMGTAGFLQVEIVGGAGTVVGHLTLEQGKALVGAGGLEVWGAQYGPDDPNCCPSSFLHSHVEFSGGRYRVVPIGSVPTAAVPAGQFP